MKKKLGAIAALLLSTLAMSIPAVSVHAQVVAEEPELIAHKITAPTSPQTSGPSLLAPPYNRVPWGLDRIDQRSNTLDNSYSFSGNGAGVKVYIVDSGVNASHPEFGSSSRVIDGWSYRASSTALVSYHKAITSQPVNPNPLLSGIDPSTGLPVAGATFADPSIRPCQSNSVFQQQAPSTFDDLVTDVVNGQKRYLSPYFTASPDNTDKGKLDNDGHGTHVAGTIGGEVTGVAKGVTIVPVRVLDSCGAGTTTMVHNGLQWILADHQVGEKAVINMSIGFDASATSIDTDIRDLLAEGIVVVAAAGNETTTSCNTTPAGTAGTISVGAIDNTSTEAYYSNFGDCVDIFAPGSDVLSTWPKNTSVNTYYLETGTSMAAPHVAGVAALQLVGRTVSSATPGDIWNWLKMNSTCDAVAYSTEPAHIRAMNAGNPQTANRLLNTGSAAGPACKPASISATAANASATITWTEPASPNGSAVTGYTATLSPGGATCNTNAVTLTCSFTGLTNNTEYTASVRGINAVGTSAQAATVTVTPIGTPLPVTNLSAAVGNNSLVMSWSQQAGDGAGITYVATAAPGGASCTAVSANTCTITGLTNGVSYSVSVVGKNSLGSSTAVSATGTPDGPPASPGSVTTSMANSSITLFWPAVTSTLGVTYKVTATPGGATCITAQTTCTMIGLKNGVQYSFEVVSIAPNGKVSASSLFSARPGFTVLTTTVKKKSKTSLSKIVTSASTGKKKWSETGLCYISAGKLVAPSRTAKCKVVLKVAKSSKYPAMSTTVTVTVK